MKNGEVLGLLSEAFSGNVDKKVESIENKIADLQVVNIKREMRIANIENSQTTLKRKVDVHDQKTRENLIIFGLKNDTNCDTICKLLNEKL